MNDADNIEADTVILITSIVNKVIMVLDVAILGIVVADFFANYFETSKAKEIDVIDTLAIGNIDDSTVLLDGFNSYYEVDSSFDDIRSIKV